MLKLYMKNADDLDMENLMDLSTALKAYPYFRDAYEACQNLLK